MSKIYIKFRKFNICTIFVWPIFIFIAIFSNYFNYEITQLIVFLWPMIIYMCDKVSSRIYEKTKLLSYLVLLFPFVLILTSCLSK